MTSFSDFIKKVFSIKQKSKLLVDFNADITTHEILIEWARDHYETALSCVSIMEYLPNINKHGTLDEQQSKNLQQALTALRKFYLTSKRESDSVIYWLNQYMKECANHGKTS